MRQETHWSRAGSERLPDPPFPQPAHSNDVSTRLTRVETYLHLTHGDRQRQEADSLARARDLIEICTGLDTRLTAVESARSQWAHTSNFIVSGMKYVLAVILIASVLVGKMTIDQARWIGGLFGMP